MDGILSTATFHWIKDRPQLYRHLYLAMKPGGWLVAFLYNAIFFTAGVVLGSFFGVPSSSIPYYLVFFAKGNLLGPILLGRLSIGWAVGR